MNSFNWSSDELTHFGHILADIRNKIPPCPICGCLTDLGRCHFCDISIRDPHSLCLLASARDAYAIEETRTFRGLYHVVEHLLSPLDGRYTNTLRVDRIESRIQQHEMQEVIIAFDSTLEGDATALYLKEKLSPLPIKITRLLLVFRSAARSIISTAARFRSAGRPANFITLAFFQTFAYHSTTILTRLFETEKTLYAKKQPLDCVPLSYYPCLFTTVSVPLLGVELYEEKKISHIQIEYDSPEPASSFDPKPVLSKLKTKEGDEFSQFTFDNDLKSLSEEYDRVQPTLRVQDDQLLITIHISPRVPSSIRSNSPETSAIRQARLQKELDIKPYSPFSTAKNSTRPSIK